MIDYSRQLYDHEGASDDDGYDNDDDGGGGGVGRGSESTPSY